MIIYPENFQEATKRLYFLKILKRAALPPDHYITALPSYIQYLNIAAVHGITIL